MKNIVLVTLAIILFFPLFACAESNSDTIDYWHVFYNKKLINQFNEFDLNPTVIISKKSIKTNDALSIDYGNDTPCDDCKTGIYTKDYLSRKIYIVKGEGTFNLLKIPLSKILAIAKEANSNIVDIYYYDSVKRNRFIFHLKIE